MATKEEIAAMTGASGTNRPPQMELDEISILGKDSSNEKYPFKIGHFRIKLSATEQPTVSKDPKTGREVKEFAQQDLGTQPLDVVFLKIRRVMTYWTPDGSPRTNEHNAKTDVITLFGADGGPQIGTGGELWERNQKLKTVQVVYAYVPSMKRIVHLIVKGVSLGMQEKQEGVTSFYEYLGSFNKLERCHEHFTRISPFQTRTPQGIVYGMNFQRGPKLDEEKIAKVEGMIQEVFAFTQESDAYYAEQQAKKGYVKPAPEQTPHQKAQAVIQNHPPADLDTIEYPEEEANVEDIPF